MMNSMMNAMVRGMSVQEREEMMLKMMPDMMKKADINSLMANMLEALSKMITLYGVYSLIKNIVNDDTLKEEFKNFHEGMIEKMPEMAPMMIPIMKEVMPKVMPNILPTMSGMALEMIGKGECLLADIADQNPEIKESMGKMMFAAAPIMAAKVIPQEKENQFVKNIEESISKRKELSSGSE